MSREQMRKLLSEPTEEDHLRAENKELHRIAEQATERGMALEVELAALREAVRLAISYCQDGQPEDAVDVLRSQLTEEKPSRPRVSDMLPPGTVLDD